LVKLTVAQLQFCYPLPGASMYTIWSDWAKAFPRNATPQITTINIVSARQTGRQLI
jgi:hypothetical protein